MKYKNTLNDYLTSPKYIQTGQGIFYFNNPHQLLDRLELLGGVMDLLDLLEIMD